MENHCFGILVFKASKNLISTSTLVRADYCFVLVFFFLASLDRGGVMIWLKLVI